MSQNVGKIATAIIDLLLPIRMFDSLDHDELRIVVRYMNVVDVKPKDIVFREGKAGNYVCFVADGTLEVIKTSESGRTVVLASLHEGCSIGEMAILDSYPRSATVRAKTAATLVTLSGRAFQDILDRHPRIGLKILIGLAKLLSQNLRYTSARLADYMLPVT